MKDFSNLFTRPLGPADRREIGRLLGMDGTSWCLEETCAGVTLRRWNREAFPCWESSSAAFEFAFDNRGPQLPADSFVRPREVWRDLLPFPFCALSEALPEVRRLALAWERAESLFSAQELSLVWVGSRTEGLPLLIHYVRRRCVRLGTHQDLVEICHRWLDGSMTRDDLRDHFGTRVGLFRLEAPSRSPSNPLDRFALALERAAPGAASDSEPETPRPGTTL